MTCSKKKVRNVLFKTIFSISMVYFLKPNHYVTCSGCLDTAYYSIAFWQQGRTLCIVHSEQLLRSTEKIIYTEDCGNINTWYSGHIIINFVLHFFLCYIIFFMSGIESVYATRVNCYIHWITGTWVNMKNHHNNLRQRKIDICLNLTLFLPILSVFVICEPLSDLFLVGKFALFMLSSKYKTKEEWTWSITNWKPGVELSYHDALNLND